MRILQLIDTLDAGGAERMAVNLANASYDTLGFGLLCATRRGGVLEKALHPAVKSIVLKKRSVYDIKALMALRTILIKHKITIIHAHSTSLATAVLVKWTLPKLKLIWHDHYGMSEFLEDRPYKYLQFFARSVDGAFAVNHLLEDWIRSQLRISKVKYVPNFVNFRESGHLETQLPGTKGKRLVCLANLRSQKNHPALITVFSQLQTKYPSWSLHLVGKDFGDAYAVSIKEKIKDLKLEKAVFLYGSRDDIPEILSQMTIGVLFSKSEGLPLALLEYGVAGLPVVTTDVGKCKEVVATYGLVIQNSNEQLLAAMERLMADAEYRAVLGRKFKEHLLVNYNSKTIFEEVKTFYEQL